jgi:hypothetical protein
MPAQTMKPKATGGTIAQALSPPKYKLQMILRRVPPVITTKPAPQERRRNAVAKTTNPDFTPNGVLLQRHPELHLNQR